jgi:hypothetical protein
LSRINCILPENKEKVFRKLVIDVYGFGQGSLAKACSEAIGLFIDKYTVKTTAKKEPAAVPEIRPVAVQKTVAQNPVVPETGYAF